MTYYIINKDRQSGYGYNHEIHKDWCSWKPSYSNQEPLGWYSSDEEALEAARLKYPDADGCIHCCPSIHKR